MAIKNKPRVKLDENGLPPVKPLCKEDFTYDLIKPFEPKPTTDPLVKAHKDNYVKSGQYLQANVHWQDFDYVPSIRSELICEYKASSISEMLIIDTVINAYFSYMRSSKALKSFIEDNDGRREYESKTWITMMKELSKVVDMANRHFATTMTLLKEFRQTPVKVKVQTAFIGQNQQFNKNA